MKFVDEFRQPELAAHLLRKIHATCSRRWTIMEVCGGQTHNLLRHGIDAALQDVVELLHGPGCPVCVTPIGAVEAAIAYALRDDFILASFGDMLRVPGERLSLLAARAQGANVRIVYSPLEAVQLAQKEPSKQVVFFAVGFETTAPATALAVLQAHRLRLGNFKVLCAHVRVQPAMEAIAQAPASRVQGFLAAGHVCTVMGFSSYADFVQRYRMPVVVTGFEPVDLLQGIYRCVEQLERGEFAVVNEYARSVRAGGNAAAQALMDEVFEVTDRQWRGVGTIATGGLSLRAEWQNYDVSLMPTTAACEESSRDCRSGDVLIGRIRPPECPHFARGCTPDNPLGAPMVSSEGACAAYYAYQSRSHLHERAGER
jgi:hydrogenase expression/formation protein HypD